MHIVKLPEKSDDVRAMSRNDMYVVMEHITAITQIATGGSYIALVSSGFVRTTMSPQEVLMYLADPSNRSLLA